MERRGPQTTSPRAPGIGGGEPRRELVELGSGARRSSCGGTLRGDIELRRDRRVRPFCGEREVTGSFLAVGDDGRERSMHGAPLELRGLLVTDRRMQRVREADTVIVERDHALPCCDVEGDRDCVGVSVDPCEQIEGRPRRRGGFEKHIPGVTGKAASRSPTSCRKLSGTRIVTRSEARVLGAGHLAADREGEEGIPLGHLEQLCELRAAELQAEAVSEHVVE